MFDDVYFVECITEICTPHLNKKNMFYEASFVMHFTVAVNEDMGLGLHLY